MISKNLHIVSLTVIFALILSGISVAQLLTVTGHVYDEQTMDPVAGHPVELQLTFQGMTQTYDFITNNVGIFGDSIPVNTIGSLYLWTLDCVDSIHSFSANFDSTNNFFSYDFYICTDSIPGPGCDNSFTYVTNNGLDFTFTGASTPVEADYYFWDFGDGETGTGKIILHTYVVNAPEVYTVTLTTMIASSPATGDSCVAVSSQEIEVGGQGGNCINWFQFSTSDYITYNFAGFSDPEAQIYLWDFGDGSSGAGQNTIHTYDPNNGGSFPVTLTTIYTIAGTTDTCVATSQQTVIVNNNPPCQADFYFIQDSISELQVNFFDNSTGLITTRSWDFGDGSTSAQLNPIHLFPGPGNYNVCLAVVNDSLGSCSDTNCQLVEISLLLHADFSFSLDTLSGLTNNYMFTDNSLGLPDSWLWDFGDGEESTIQSPVHQYTSSGDYDVCLLVTRNYPNIGLVTDSHCETITTPEYLDFGGQVFLDNYPLNNYNGDTTVVDTGIAFLYRKYYNAVIPVDTNIFFQYGYYWFSQERAGDYIIKIGLTQNSLHYPDVLTTYYQSSKYWYEANTLHLADTNNYFANVELKSIPGVATGPGSISGSLIVLDNIQPSSDLAARAEIILADENENVLSFTTTDENGNFSFTNLSLATYNVAAEVTGMNSYFYLVELNGQNPITGNITLEVNNNALDINETIVDNVHAGNVFPNPVNEHFAIDITSEKQTTGTLEIYSIVGQKTDQQSFNLNSGKNLLQVNCSRLTGGVYILKITTTTAKSGIIRKFVK